MFFTNKIQNIYNHLLFLLPKFKNIINVANFNNLPTQLEHMIIGTNKLPLYTNKSIQEVYADDLGNIIDIGKYAFYRHSNLKLIEIPDSVTTIDIDAFRYCTGLTSITIPDSVTSIDSYAFEYCSKLESITIGRGVTIINNQAFNSCPNLWSVHITDLYQWCQISFINNFSNPLYSAGADLYLNDEMVVDLVIPDGITEIKNHAFERCGSIESVTVPDSVITIADNAFAECLYVGNVTIGSGIKSIGAYAFQAAPISDLYIYASVPPSLANTNAILSATTIHVPIGSGEAYESATNWSRYSIREDIQI